MNRTLGAASLAAAATLFVAGCSTSTAAPESQSSPMESQMSESASPTSAGTIVDVAAGNEDFSTLVAAVQAAGLAETLSQPGPYTVFAPTNEAFEALPAGVLDKLLEPQNKQALTQILTYHVVSGEVTSDQIKPGKVDTVEGESVTITTQGGVKVNEALVVTPDVEASNGVIHVIDAVLLPPDVDVDKL